MRWREPTKEEQTVLGLAEIDSGLSGFATAYTNRLIEFKRRSAALIGDVIRDAKLEGSDLATADIIPTFPGREALQADLLRLLNEMAEFGQLQVAEELARQ